MFLRITAFSLLIWCILITVSCKREYSYEGGPGAVFSFIGSPDACVNSKVNGNYYTGIALDSGSSVELMVQVTEPGNYNISTTPQDGITFSGSGNFTDTGLQVIVLPGSGIANAAGVLQIAVPGTGGCYFAVTVTPPQPANFALSGAPTDCTEPSLAGNYITGKELNDLNKLVINVDVFATGPYTITTDTIAGVHFAASGSFTATGNQQVTLQGSGTCSQPGLYYIGVHAGSTVCGFYLQVQNAEPLATYVLQSSVIGDGLICTPSSIQGFYSATTPVMRTNTATVSAYVTQPGNYTIATSRVNGVIFQYSGTFTTIGAQDVVLFASGTPQQVGNFLYTAQIIGPAPLGGNACSFNIPVK